MTNFQEVNISYILTKEYLNYINSREIAILLLKYKVNMNGRIFLELIDYLMAHKLKVNYFLVTDEPPNMLPYGDLGGFLKYRYGSRAHVNIQPFFMDENETVDFSYPFKLYSYTFATRKPEYQAHIFGIFQMFSVSTWTAIISVLIALLFIYYFTLKWKYSFDKIILNIIGIFVRQSSIFRPTSMGENMLIYSWVFGAMILCLAYESVFLSFLAIPPINRIKDMEQLSKAVKNGEYHCIAELNSGLPYSLQSSKLKYFNVIGRDLEINNLNFEVIRTEFQSGKIKENIAFLVLVDTVVYLPETLFVSEDRFLESSYGMRIAKSFCCKNLIDTFVHRLMCSGLYFKFWSDSKFLFRLPFSREYQEENSSNRKLTLTDVAPAFMILIVGYFISFIFLIIEILANRSKNMKKIKKIKIRFMKRKEYSV